MTATITVQPSGHQFQVEEGETILEAALRSGLNLNYHCSNGSCGECVGRVVSGELAEVKHHDYRLKREEKANGSVLLCRALAGSDMVVEAGEAHTAADIPVQTVQTTVSKIERPTDDVMVLNLRTPRSNTLRFLAGQYAVLRVNGLKPRSKSIASCPCNGMLLHFHVRRVPGDPFSDFMFNEVKLRNKVEVEGPYGDFILDEESGRPLIFIAFETGFGPVKSLIEHAISLDMGQPIRLYWIARSKEDHYLANYCRSWHDALDDFEFHSLVSGHGGEALRAAQAEVPMDWDHLGEVERGMVEAVAQVIADHPDIAPWDVYVNGPGMVLEPTRQLLLNHGLPDERLFVDEVKRF